MWYYVVCLLLAMRCVEGSLGDQMAEIMQLCCHQGTSYARNHSVEDCSSSVPPNVPAKLGSLCIFAMDQCCKEYFTKQQDCESGIVSAMALTKCSSLTKESAKICCRECSTGISLAKSSQSSDACSVKNIGNSAEEMLAADALSACCKNISATESQREDTSTKKTSDNEVIASVCEEYAPNELCAHHCIPIPGSYKCKCNPGFMLMADGRNCIEITRNRCKPKNPCHHRCIDNGIEVKCSCRRGYQLMVDQKTCEDIDECNLDPPVCLPSTQCFNILGSYKCIPKKLNQDKAKCPPGFARNLLNNACDDINECKLPNPPCPSYICENTIGGYKCGGMRGDPENLDNKRPVEDRCPPGFRSGANEECEDIDECDSGKDDCNKISQFCINTRGSFYCQDKASKHCPPGFKTNPLTNKCEDINECDDGEDICKPDQVCVNVPGEYDCRAKDTRVTEKCPEGMRINPLSNVCEDINECVEGTHLCDQYQNCLNTNGSHECHCKLGFELDPTTGACIDINECATDQNNCIPESQRCDNTVGSFLCIRFISCGTGYILHHSSSTCEDIDECALGSHNCDRAGPEYHCVNIPGSFRCQRRPRTTTPAPEYEDYYYSEEDIEDDEKDSNKTEVFPTSSTTTQSTLVTSTESSSKSTSRPALAETKPTIATPTVTPNLPTIESEIPEDNLDNDINRADYKPAFKETDTTPKKVEEEYEHSQPNNPDIDNENKVLDSNRPYDTTEPQNKFTPSIEREPSSEYPKVTETTYSSIPIKPTSPGLVNVNINKEEEIVTSRTEKDINDIYSITESNNNNKWPEAKPMICQVGFEMDQYGACYDIDECESDQHTCSGLTEACKNTMGGYLCECALGFRRDLVSESCIPITTSSSSTSTSSTTSTTSTTSTSTTSTTSTTTSTTETPSTTVIVSSTSTTSTTTPAPTTSPTTKRYFFGYPEYRPLSRRPFRPRSFCDVGYHFNFQTKTCEDIDECTNGQMTCGSAEICVNTEGGYRCECLPNWRLDTYRHKCVPVWNKGQFPPGYGNIPVNNNKKPSSSEEERKPDIIQVEDKGTVSICPSGTRLNEFNICEDVDECVTGEAQCGPLQICRNLNRGYSCSCPPGYRLVGDHQCEDVDECAVSGDVPICSQNADCINTMGSYMCRCHTGFRSAPVNEKVCVDVDECSESRAGYLCQQHCSNVWGSYRCSCYRGYRLNPDNRTCSDIDECSEFKDRLCLGTCLNEPGSYRCTCPSGYRLSEDKKSCIDIDECETGVATCGRFRSEGVSDVCLNTRGSYRCHRIVCPNGYQLQNEHRCSKIQSYCPPSDWECTHQPTTYSYNFMTFVSNLYIPESKVDLFTMRGPSWAYAKMKFLLGVVKVDAPPSVKVKADINCFLLKQTGNQAVISLVKPLEGPQSVELELSMELFSHDQFGGIAVAKLFIYVSEYEF